MHNHIHGLAVNENALNDMRECISTKSYRVYKNTDTDATSKEVLCIVLIEITREPVLLVTTFYYGPRINKHNINFNVRD